MTSKKPTLGLIKNGSFLIEGIIGQILGPLKDSDSFPHLTVLTLEKYFLLDKAGSIWFEILNALFL